MEKNGNEPIRVLIVEDNDFVRSGLRTIIEAAPDMVVVGEAINGRQAVELAEQLLPDIIVMDLNLPGMDGLTATRLISQNAPSCQVLVLTYSDDPQDLLQAVLAGAKGYLVHSQTRPADLLQAIRTVHGGGAIITPAIAPALLEFIRRPLPPGIRGLPGLPQLTPREFQILDLIQAGLSNREIAQRLGIEEKTVKNHINNIYSKLNLRSRYEAILYRPESGTRM